MMLTLDPSLYRHFKPIHQNVVVTFHKHASQTLERVSQTVFRGLFRNVTSNTKHGLRHNEREFYCWLHTCIAYLL